MTARVSVAMATFNGGQFIAEQLRSILAQTVAIDQIVIADDGSRDDSVGIARDVLATFAGELTVLEPERRSLGVTKNFERALRACTGDLIALSDQDDVWHVDKLERMIAPLGEDGLLAFSDASLVGELGQPLKGEPVLFGGIGLTDWERSTLFAGDAWPVFLRRNLVTGATVVIRRALLDLAGEFPESWVHDEWLAIVAAANGGVRLVDEPTIDYRQHGANQIGMRSKLTWKIRMERLKTPRTQRNSRLFKRAQALAAWAGERARFDPSTVLWNRPATSSLRSTTEIWMDAEEKLAHETVRSELPAARFDRVPSVRREMKTGRYERFGLGKQDVLRDLVQPV